MWTVDAKISEVTPKQAITQLTNQPTNQPSYESTNHLAGRAVKVREGGQQEVHHLRGG
jgi:hypothetical protein